MSQKPAITLHYFAARGRAQFIRYYLTARPGTFDDHRIALSADFSEWAAIRDDRSVTGPFKRLPVLAFDGEQVAETLTIASFLHERLGDAAELPARENLRHSMLLSSLHGDLMIPLGTLIWADRFYPGVDLGAHLQITLRRLHAYLRVLDEALADWGWPLSGRSAPLLAECLLWEELDAARTILGEFLGIDDFATLGPYYAESEHRDSFLRYIESNPSPFTAHPAEPEAIESIQEVLRASEGEKS